MFLASRRPSNAPTLLTGWASSRIAAFVSALCALSLVLLTVGAAVTPAVAAEGDQVALNIVKTATKGAIDSESPGNGQDNDTDQIIEVEAGETFVWLMQLTCSAVEAQCVDAVFRDSVPDEFEIDAGAITVSGVAAGNRTLTVSGQDVTIAFHEPLSSPVGTTGLKDGLYWVQIPVKTRALTYADNGREVTNTGRLDATNAQRRDVTDPATVRLVAPLELAASASKSFTPTSNLAVPDLGTTLRIQGANTSNAPVDTVTIQDPVAPGATPNIFRQHLAIDAVGAITWPDGAGRAELFVHRDGSWTSAATADAGGAFVIPPGLDLADVGGVRVVFTADQGAGIAVGGTGGLALDLVHRPSVSDLVDTTTLTNDLTVTTSLDGTDSSPATSTARYELGRVATSVAARKSFSPERIAAVPYEGAGNTSTVTLGASNTGSTSLTSLTIAEPSVPEDRSASNPLAPAHPGGGLVFSGFSGSVRWPAGATAAEVTYHFASSAPVTLAADGRDTLPPAPGGAGRVTGFSVTFTGSIPTSAEALTPFVVEANPAQTAADGGLTVGYDNEITVTGTDPYGTTRTAQAEADLTVYADQITLTTAKRLTRDALLALPGQRTTAVLTTRIADFPETTRRVNRIEIVDPEAESGLTDWYRFFDAAAITQTQIPSNATLTVSYRDEAGDYVVLPGMEAITATSPGVVGGYFSAAIPAELRDAVYGIKLTYESAEGFVPGQTLSPNVTFALRSTMRGTDPAQALVNEDVADLENTTASRATAGSITSNRPDDVAAVDLVAVPAGGPDMLDKRWTTDDRLPTRSGSPAGVLLGWSTGGIAGLEQVVVSDTALAADGSPARPLADSVFDAFDLVSVPAIVDPLLAHDAVRIQLFDGTSWVDAGSPCRVSSPCQGSFPGYTLTAAERASTQAVRFVFTERSARTSTNPAHPQAGEGVALSIGNERSVRLTFALRDALRSDASRPVLEGTTFNTAVAGQVRNTASVQGYLPGDVTPSYTDEESDDITVADPDLGVSATKEWAGGPVAVPQDPTAPRPATRVTLTGTTTGAGAVDSLTVQDPDLAPLPGAVTDTTAEFFDYSRFHALAFPAGTTEASVVLSLSDGGTREVEGAPAAVVTTVLAMSEAELADVVGVVLTAEGRIRQGGTVRAVFDLRLRAAERTTGDAVTAQTGRVDNTVAAVVADPRYRDGTLVTDSLTDRDAADVHVTAAEVAVTATKAFSPANQTEPTRAPITMTLGATPAGSERTSALVLTDESATFWNAFDFQSVASSFSLPAFSPAGSPLVVRAEVCVGRTFVAADVSADRGCVADGGTWVTRTVGGSPWLTPAQVASSILPDGVEASDVTGLRLTVQRLDGSQWENPYAPTITVPARVQRREALRSGGPVPSTLVDGASAAPGETAKGTTTNVLVADVSGILGGSASASATAAYTYRHALTGVRVEKSPTGTKAPGAPFDYTLTVTNTGAVPLVNPVIVDELPSDADGAMLVFDPESENGPSYAFALSGTSPTTPSGPQMPVSRSDVDVAVELDGEGPSRITFAFPGQTVLEVGQTYTIVFPLQFRAGVGQGVEVTNAFGVKADRAFDSCTAPAGRDAVLGGDGFCRTQTTVRPSMQPALRALKSVRTLGTPDDLGYTEGSPQACPVQAAADDGFTSSPCVPRNAPGQDQEWRLRVVNQGTTELSRVIVTDLLPVPGDATVVSNLGRGSQWAPVFNGEITLPHGAGRTLRAYYTTARTPCTTVLRAPGGTATCSSDPSVGWALWDATAGIDPSTVTALQFEVDFAPGSYLQPGRSFDVLVQTTAPAVSQTPGEDTVAFNSISASAMSRQGGSDVTVSAADYRRVGLALVTGDITLTKVLSGPVADQVPDGTVFSGEVVCTSLGEEVRYPFSLTSPDALTATFEGLPAYATCEAVETSDSGQSSAVSSTVTVDPAATTTLPTLALTNEYPWASLRVSKQVTSPSATVPTGFELTVACTFLGTPVVLPDATFRLDAGEERVFRNIPAQSDCVITETDARDADDTIVAGSSTTGAVSLDQAARSVTIAGLGADTSGGEPANDARFDNRYGADAAVLVTKRLVGASAAQLGQDVTFSVQVRCTFSGETVLDETVRLHQGNGWTAQLDSVIADAVCVVVEDDLAGADGVTITPHDASDRTVGVLTVPASGVAQVVVENRYLTGALEVTKEVTGDGADAFGTGPFTVELVCVRDDVRLVVAGGGTRQFAAGETLQFEHLPNGATCTLSETADGGAGAVRVRGADGAVLSAGASYAFTVVVDEAQAPGADEPQPSLTLENVFRTTQVQVTKEVRSDARGADGRALDRGAFTVRLSCTLAGRPVRGALDPEQTVSAGQTVTWTGLPERAECAVAEPDPRGARVAFEVAGAAVEAEPDGTLALGPLELRAERNVATLVNTYGSGSVMISKLVRGQLPAAARDSSFLVQVRCTLAVPGAQEVVVRDESHLLSAVRGLEVSVDHLPVGATCSVVETETGGADSTRIAVAGTWTSGTAAQVLTQESTVAVTIENTFAEGETTEPPADPEPEPEEPDTLPVTGPAGLAALLGVGAFLAALGALLTRVARRGRGVVRTQA